jgi:hypothetical protein
MGVFSIMKDTIEIQCNCGQFKAKLDHFPSETPGRLGCYCDDCQAYMIHLGRTELLDKAGCTEIVPVYPRNVSIVSGESMLECIRLSDKGMYRWVASCCNSPIGNTAPGRAWVGVHAHMFKARGSSYLNDTLGPIKSRILGKYAKGQPAPGTPMKMDFTAMKTVLPFMLKGVLRKAAWPSPFFRDDKKTPIKKPKTLTTAELADLKAKQAAITSY